MIPLSVSTAWNAGRCGSGREVVAQIRQAGFSRMELGFSLSGPILAEILACREEGIIGISSAHNFCPVPDGYPADNFFPDHFSLASRDPAERRQAVELTAASLRTVRRAQAASLVVHGGRVEMPPRMKDLARMHAVGAIDSAAAVALRDRMRRERAELLPEHLSALLQSIEELLPVAEREQVCLCLENRYYYRELPGPEEWPLIFSRFAGHEFLKYWHDVGHAQVSENLGFSAHATLWRQNQQWLAGIHLHDVIGGQDHLPPGHGMVEFSDFIDALTDPSIIKVLEFHGRFSPEEVGRSGEFIQSLISNPIPTSE